jgi:hypothetical protein
MVLGWGAPRLPLLEAIPSSDGFMKGPTCLSLRALPERQVSVGKFYRTCVVGLVGKLKEDNTT